MSKVKTVILGLSLLAMGGVAAALDANDVSQMVRNGVQDSVIINMVQNQKLDRPLTAQEVMLLNTNGASPTLLEYLTRPEAVSAAYAPAPAPTVVTGSDDVTYAAPSTTVVTPAPTVVTQACPTTTYVNPNYIYPAPTYVAPSYVYPYTYGYPHYRYRSGPSYSFGFSFGGGRRWHGGPRHYGPPRRHGGGHRGGGRRR